MADTLNSNRDLLAEARMREHLIDGAKASPVAGYLMVWASGITIADWATFLACVYSVLLIVDKLRQMHWLRQWITKCLQRLKHKRA
jgi:hypothetical protein